MPRFSSAADLTDNTAGTGGNAMARQRPGFGWPVSVLKRRGWTSELIRDLLPGPQVVHWERRAVRVWDKDAVRTAERDPRFAEGSVKKTAKAAPGARHACFLLSQAWDEAEQALQNFLNSSADTGSGGANNGIANTGKTDEQLEEDGTDRQSKENGEEGQPGKNGEEGQPGKNQSDGQSKKDQAADKEGTQGNQTGSQDNAAERETQKAALEQAVAEAKAAYEAAVSSRVDNLRTAARALEDAAMAKSTPDSSAKQNEITKKQQELTLNKLQALKDAGGEVKATVNGIVKQVLVTTGDLTSDGAAVRLADTSEGGRLTVSVEKQYAEYLVTGSPVDLKPSGSKNVISDYTISSVTKNPQDDNLVDFTVDLPKDAIETGTFVEATIVPKSESYATVIPLQALRGGQGEYYVLVLEEEQGVMGSELVVKRLNVQVVDKNSTSAALEEGLLTGEQEIISSSSRMIQEGSKVRRMSK